VRKLLIANRGDSRRAAAAAAKGHIGNADVSRSQTAWRAKRAAIEPRE
jgi:hypothetical protein